MEPVIGNAELLTQLQQMTVELQIVNGALGIVTASLLLLVVAEILRPLAKTLYNWFFSDR